MTARTWDTAPVAAPGTWLDGVELAAQAVRAGAATPLRCPPRVPLAAWVMALPALGTLETRYRVVIRGHDAHRAGDRRVFVIPVIGRTLEEVG